MLEGYDTDWKNAGKDRIVYYSDVPGGTYTFKVKAFLLESPDKYDLRTIEVVVPASYLSTGLTLALILLFVAAAIYLAFRYREKLFHKKR
jgi:hypothetical protein